MKKLLPIVVTFLCCTFFTQKATAQLDLISDLLGLLQASNNNNYNQFFTNLSPLDSTFSVDHVHGNQLLNELYDELEKPNPAGMLDSVYLMILSTATDSLESNAGFLGLSDLDADTLITELHHVEDVFENNFEELQGVYSQYQDSLNVDSMANWNVTIIGFDEITETNLQLLHDTLSMHDVTPPRPELELAFGMQQASLKYFDDAYDATARVIRVGSVPSIDQNSLSIFNSGLPIEASWHVEMSFMTRSTPTAASDPAITIRNGRDFYPLLFFGDFSIVAKPVIGVWGNTTFRILSSIGVEAGTYAPAHRDYNPPFTSANLGFATGTGPQLGAGFSMTTGNLLIYSMSTIGYGDALKTPKDYKYDSKRFEVGMRFADIINVRYTKGLINWQPDDNRRAKINNQITIGIILPELYH